MHPSAWHIQRQSKQNAGILQTPVRVSCAQRHRSRLGSLRALLQRMCHIVGPALLQLLQPIFQRLDSGSVLARCATMEHLHGQ